MLPALTVAQDVYEDYVSTRLTLREHSISLLNDQLSPRVVSTAQRDHPDGTPISTSGLVVVRQRPGTANGTIFLSLEDEGGVSNIIIWGSLFERFRKEIMSGRLVRVHGKFQRQGIVTTVIADCIEDMSHLLDAMGDGDEVIYPGHDNADHVRSPVQSSTSIARNQAAAHVPKPAKSDPLGAEPKTDRSKDKRSITDYYAHGGSRHPRTQAGKLFPSRNFR